MWSKCSLVLLLSVGVVQGWLWARTRKCYDPYGCFENKDPFDNTDLLPDKPSDIGLGLWLLTRSNSNIDTAENLSPTDQSTIKNSKYSISKKLVAIVHGYRDSGKAAWVKSMAAAILAHDDVNLIIVNWKDGAASLYGQATANTRLVGKMVATLLQNINQAMGTAFSTMHIIGHSLGAHIAGYVGENINGLGRISGLDPAGLNFENFKDVVRLDPTDATFVDVIHTDDDKIFEFGWGTGKDMGHLDFYPNGGENQPGCNKDFWAYIGNLLTDWTDFIDQVACSHMRVLDLYTSSITSCTYTGAKCDSYTNYKDKKCTTPTNTMGYWATHGTDGKYYLETSSTSPYCQV